MWQRFTQAARKIVFDAQVEAAELGEKYVSTEHLLLGLTRTTDSVAARILDDLGVSLARVRNEVERQVRRGPSLPDQDMQLTPRAKRVIDLAYDEARQQSKDYIGTEHILIGLIRESDGVAGLILHTLGVRLEAVRRQALILEDSENEARSDRHGPKSDQSKTYHLTEIFAELEGFLDLGEDDLAITHLMYALLFHSARDCGKPVIVQPNRSLTKSEVQVVDGTSARLIFPPRIHEALLRAVTVFAGIEDADPRAITSKARTICCGGRSCTITVDLVPSEYGQQIVLTSLLGSDQPGARN